MAKVAKAKFLVKHFSLVVALLLFITLSVMTVGFARYNRILKLSGAVQLNRQGDIFISIVTLKDSKNISSTPSFTRDSINFNLAVHATEQNQEAYAQYDVELKNESLYHQYFSINYWQPRIRHNSQEITMPIDYEFIDIKNGDRISQNQTKTFGVRLRFQPSAVGDYQIDGVMQADFANSNTGALLAEILAPTNGDLRTPNVHAPFTLHITNSYAYAQTFSFDLRDNSHFRLVDTNGEVLNPITLSGESSMDYLVYVKIHNNPVFTSPYERAGLILRSENLGEIDCGRITLQVNQANVANDHTAPKISHVTIAPLDALGEAKVNWQATDDSSIAYFSLQLVNSAGQVVQTATTSDDAKDFVFRNISDGDYFVKVYGKDAFGNTASQSVIDNCAQSAGSCSRSPRTRLVWRFKVNTKLSAISSTGSNQALRGETYVAILASRNKKHTLPNSITVQMGGRTLVVGMDYEYSSNTGRLSIPRVSGDLSITARAIKR